MTRRLPFWADSLPYGLLAAAGALGAAWVARDLWNLPQPPAAGPPVVARVEGGAVPDEALPVQTMSLIPYYRARVEAKAPAVLESPRMFIPGYVARRNGRPVAVLSSREGRVAVNLAPGPNDVEIRFVGSPGLRRAAWISLVCWAGVAFFGWAEIKRTLRA
jgi:hypothetical protein